MRIHTFLTALAVASFPLSAQADITRGCKAIWAVKAGSNERTFGLFDSRGRCKGKVYANDCRRAARGYAQECFREAWARRWEEDIRSGKYVPSACLARGDIRVRDYKVKDIKRQVELQACAMGLTSPFTVQVIGRTWDGKRCDGEIFLSNYDIKPEMCGKIGG